jgi:hypothetical protein
LQARRDGTPRVVERRLNEYLDEPEIGRAELLLHPIRRSIRAEGDCMRKLLATLIAAIALAFTAGPSLAVVPPHNHWLTTGSGDVVHVGPYVCDNPDIYDAWLNFHLNVHVGVPGTQAFTNPSNPVSISATLCPS